MRILIKTSIAGADWSASPGDVVNLKKEEAQRLIAAGYATEIAVVKPKENAMKRAPQARRKGKL
jgi:hypothetical protein